MGNLSGLPGRGRFEIGEPNPVLVKELRSRFRGPRAFLVLTTFLTLLTLTAWLMYAQSIRRYSSQVVLYGSSPPGAEIGQGILQAVALVELLLIALIGPALLADSVSGEVERQTWDLLRATPLSGVSIMFGKTAAAFAYVLLLALCALPVMGLSFIFGGVSLSSVLRIQGSMLTAGLLFLALGGFWSSMMNRTGRAAILAYASVGLLVLAPFTVPVIVWILTAGNPDDPMRWPVWPHLMTALSPLSELLMRKELFSTTGAQPGTIWLTWVLAMLLRVVVALGLLLAASARIRPLTRWAVLLLLLCLTGGILWVVGVSMLDVPVWW